MSEYKSKRAQEAVARVEAVKVHINERRGKSKGRLSATDFKEMREMFTEARRELRESIRTEELVASGVTPDVSSLLDGAL